MVIIGAGLAGLIAGALLRDEAKEIWEAQPSLPDNHSALLRFKSSILGDSLNIPFKEVTVIKDIQTTGNDLRDILSYSKKTIGSYSIRSIKKEIVKRYIAPDDFAQRIKKKVMAEIKFNQKLSYEHIVLKSLKISTVPMPILLNMISHPFGEISFQSKPGTVISANIRNCNMYCTMYFPHPDTAPYRVSITGSRMIIEIAGSIPTGEEVEIVQRYADILGIESHDIEPAIEIKEQKFMKILPIDEEKRKRIILWLTEEFNIYSFGRFATWRPGLLLDDLVKDLRVIQKIVASKNNYDQRRG